jgi:hypothetical protein
MAKARYCHFDPREKSFLDPVFAWNEEPAAVRRSAVRGLFAAWMERSVIQDLGMTIHLETSRS